VTATLRQATDADLPAIRGVIKAAYARYLGRMDRPPAPVLNDYRAATAGGQVWVLGEPVIGVIVLMNEEDSLLVENIAVSPAAQGSGHGRRLMEFAEQQARSRGLSRLALYTNEIMTENLAIYSRLGYHETARRTEEGYRRVFMEKLVPREREALSRGNSLPS
jgi:ribosomal protein S18 acetylase RimI-like enzyme